MIAQVVSSDLADLVTLLETASSVYAEAVREVGFGPSDFSVAGDVEAALTERLARLGDSAHLRFLVGLSLLTLGAHGVARPQFQKALQLDPSYLNAHRGLAIALMASGNVGAAVGIHTSIINALPHDVLSRNTMLKLLRSEDAGHAEKRQAFRIYQAEFFQANPGLGADLAPVADFIVWCGAAGVPMTTLDPTQDVRIGATAVNDAVDYQADTTVLAEIPGAGVIGGWDFVRAPTGEVLDGSGYLRVSTQLRAMPHLFLRESGAVVFPASADTVDVPGQTLFLGAPALFNVGHWVSDFLPRLRGRGVMGDGPMRVAVPEGLHRRYREFLDLCDHDLELFSCKRGQRYGFERLVVMASFDHNRPQPEAVRFLRARLARPASGKRRVFFQRPADAFGRRIANPGQMNALLSEFGFETLRLSELSVAAQTEILADTALVIASRGADLAAMYQLRPGCELIVFVPSEDGRLDPADADLRQFERYAAIIGMRIHYIPCRAAGAKKKNVLYQDVDVDPGALRAKIEDILERRPDLRF